MNNIRAKKFINLLSRIWKIKEVKFLLEIVDFLDKNTDKKLSFYSDFEFSLIEDEPKVRLLHLNFWQLNLSSKVIKKIIEKREKAILFFFRKISQKFKCSYNSSLPSAFFQYNRENGLWPIQFGLEYQNNSLPIIKIYLSVEERYPKRKKEFSLKKFSDFFNLNFQNLNKIFKNKKFDTIAFDFLPNNRYFLKFYPYSQENQGYLYRILLSSKIHSIKSWQRFPAGLLFEEISEKFFLPLFLRKFIKKNKVKIHYLCQEKNKQSIYFR